MTNASLFCSICNSQLISVYDSNDSDDRNTSALELSEQEKQDLEQRHAMLSEVLQNLNYAKKTRLISQIDLNEEITIYLCLVCRKVYDSHTINYQNITHSDSNMLPFKKIEEHSIVSADQESIDDAVARHNKQDIFLSQKTADYYLKTHKQGTKFSAKSKLTVFDNEIFARNIQQLEDRYGKKNTRVNIKIGR